MQAFLAPVLACGVIGAVIEKDISITGIAIGAILGIILAEYIRRNIGLSSFFGDYPSFVPTGQFEI